MVRAPNSAVRLLLAAGCASSGAVSLAAQDAVDFVRDVRPILSQHCFACHGPDRHSREADLDLSEREPALAVIEPGSLAKSELWHRINDAEDPMPPREAHNDLNAEQIGVLRRWIVGGASYAPHWAYVDPIEAELPKVEWPDWPRTRIDQFLWLHYSDRGLSPASDADPATLRRRLNYDLLGLPPSIADVEAFVRDPDLEEVVDRLLDSPHFGERMAMMWLDLVRFADTVGYHGDQDHRVWPYRDYVIDAFNRNLPFDRFTIEQLAGDLLPEPTQQQLVATTYNRLLQTSHEGGLQLGEYREIYLADRVRNVSAVWMGATVGCAQCHDHKFDPYTARDFYSLGAFFADIDDEEHLRNPYGGLNSTPTKRVPEMRVFSADASAQLQQLEAAVQTAERARAAALAELPQRRDAWIADRRAGIAKQEVEEVTWIDDAVETGGRPSGEWTFVRDAQPAPHSGAAYRTQSSKGLVQHYTVDTDRRTIEVEAKKAFFAWIYIDANDPCKAVMLQFHRKGGGWEHRAVWGNDAISYGRRKKSWAGYQRMGPLPETGDWVRLEVPFERLGLKDGQIIDGVAFSQFAGTVHWDRSGHRSPFVSADLQRALLADPRSAADRRVIDEHHRRTDGRVVDCERRLELARAAVKRVTDEQPMTMFTRALAEPRQVRIRPRGNWLDDSGEVVEPAIPAFFGKLDTDGRASRLDLASWLVARDGHGLRTARVFVNRVWAMFFGAGLCPSTEDFGGQGRPPNHPQLLDHLALQFVDSGWDVKALVKRIVSTRAYRMSSMATAEALAADPFNESFARQSRRRMPAEMIRDTALSLAGLLVARVGGPSAKPPQPSGYYRHLNFPQRRYHADKGEEQWRRGVYVHWQRQFLHPMLRAFDAPTREECVSQRPVSNTPTAALTLLNDPVFVEAARMFAQRALSREGDDEQRIRWAFRSATARVPSARETELLHALLQRNREHFAANRAHAGKLLQIGVAKRDESIDVVEHAAWAEVTRAILNLHEVISRG